MTNFGGIFDLESKEVELSVLEKESGNPELWNDQDKAQALLKKITSLKKVIADWNEVSSTCNDLSELYEMAKSEPDSQELFDNVEEEFKTLLHRVDEMEFRRMLSGPDDACAAVLTIHPGAGGTEAHDWAEMLLRMYQRFLEREGMDFKVIDVQEGEVA